MWIHPISELWEPTYRHLCRMILLSFTRYFVYNTSRWPTPAGLASAATSASFVQWWSSGGTPFELQLHRLSLSSTVTYFVNHGYSSREHNHMSERLMVHTQIFWAFFRSERWTLCKGTVIGSFRGHTSSVRHLRKSDGRFWAAKFYIFPDDPNPSTHFRMIYFKMIHSKYAGGSSREEPLVDFFIRP